MTQLTDNPDEILKKDLKEGEKIQVSIKATYSFSEGIFVITSLKRFIFIRKGYLGHEAVYLAKHSPITAIVLKKGFLNETLVSLESSGINEDIQILQADQVESIISCLSAFDNFQNQLIEKPKSIFPPVFVESVKEGITDESQQGREQNVSVSMAQESDHEESPAELFLEQAPDPKESPAESSLENIESQNSQAPPLNAPANSNAAIAKGSGGFEKYFLSGNDPNAMPQTASASSFKPSAGQTLSPVIYPYSILFKTKEEWIRFVKVLPNWLSKILCQYLLPDAICHELSCQDPARFPSPKTNENARKMILILFLGVIGLVWFDFIFLGVRFTPLFFYLVFYGILISPIVLFFGYLYYLKQMKKKRPEEVS